MERPILYSKITDKSPITYPGSKNLARKDIVGILQALGAESMGLCSPFMGGGSVELYAAAQGIEVNTSDTFQPLTHFYQTLQSKPQHLAHCIYYLLKDMGYKTTFGGKQNEDTRLKLRYISKRCFKEKEPLKRAAYFYIRNKTCYAGLMFKDVRPGADIWDNSIAVRNDSKRDISIEGIKRLYAFNTPMKIELLDYREALDKHTDAVYYFDPPYKDCDDSRLYGCNGDLHKGFNHVAFFNEITGMDRDWLVSYNNHPFICDLYKDYHIIKKNWTYGMTNERNSNEPRELLICSRNPYA